MECQRIILNFRAARVVAGRTLSIGLIFGAILTTTVLAQSDPELAHPTGSWHVGTRTFDWVDGSRGEPATQDTSDRRTVVVQIWYPTDVSLDVENEQARAPYMLRLEAYRQTTEDDLISRFGSVLTNSVLDVPISTADPFYPVVLFSHGWGGSRSWYSVILEHVASHGYVVVGVDHPYMGEVAMPDGLVTTPDDSFFKSSREASDWYASDLMFVISKLIEENALGTDWARRLDVDRVATVGHSSGGSAAAAAASRDTRVRAFSSFDAGVQRTAAEAGVPKPVMLFRVESGSYTAVLERPPGTNEKGTIYPPEFFRDRNDPFYEVIIRGTTHGSFGDYATLFGDSDERSAQLAKRRVVVRYLVAFLDKHLKGREVRLLDGAHDSDVAELKLH